MAAYKKLTERNVVLRKLKAKPENKVTSFMAAYSSSVPTSIKKRIGPRNTGGGLAASKLTSQTPVEESDIKSSAGNEDLQSGGPKWSSAIPNISGSSSLSFQVEQESDEARKRFTNAKSISSAQFFGDDYADELRSKTTLTEKFNENFWWFVNKMDELFEIPEDPAVDVYGLRREVAELTLKLRSQDAASIPYLTRSDMIANLRFKIRLALDRYRNPRNEILLKSAARDLYFLELELSGFEREILYHPSAYKPCLIEK